MIKYLIIIEKTEAGFTAYSPDLPGCVAAGATLKQVKENMRTAILVYLEGLCLDNFAIPQPTAQAAYIHIPD